jgi:hypothetical protein
MIEFKMDILFQAIENNITIEMRPTEKDRENILFFSKLLGCDVVNQDISIDFPIASAELIDFRLNESVVIKFIFNDTPFFFNTQILYLSSGQLTAESDKQKMILAMPETIFGEDRRSHLKLSTPPFMVTVKILKSADFVKPLNKRTYKSTAVNISSGGIAIENSEGKLPLIAGDILELTIALPGHAIPMKGEVLNTYPIENSERISFGIRFIQDTMEPLTQKSSVKRITQYVMRREIELLAKL